MNPQPNRTDHGFIIFLMLSFISKLSYLLFLLKVSLSRLLLLGCSPSALIEQTITPEEGIFKSRYILLSTVWIQTAFMSRTYATKVCPSECSQFLFICVLCIQNFGYDVAVVLNLCRI